MSGLQYWQESVLYWLLFIRSTWFEKYFYGDAVARVANAQDVRLNEKLALGAIVILIFWMGVYPQSVLNITNEISDSILKISDVRHLLTK